MVLGNTSIYKSSFNRSKPVKNSINEDTSLFINSLELLKETDDFFNNLFREANRKVILAEASYKNEVYLQEFSIKDIIEDIISFFIKVIKSIYEKFKSLFIKVVSGDDKLIKKYEDQLRNMHGEFELTFPRFNYTYFDADIPSINLKNEFFESYSILEGKLKEISDLKTKTERAEKMRSIEADVNSEINSTYYDLLRQRTLDTKYIISSETYPEELYDRFRDNGKQLNSKINALEVSMVLDRYLNHKMVLKSIENMKNDTIDAAKEIEKKIKSLRLKNVNTHYEYDSDEEVLFNRILQKRCGQINEVCNIFVMAFAAKCDAVKEAAVQDKKVLLKAIKFITGGEE